MFFKSTLLPPHPVRWVKFHCWSSEFCDLTKVTHEARPPASGSEHLVSHPGLRRPKKADPTLQTPVNNAKTVFVPPPPTRTLRSNSSQSPPRSSPLHRPQEAPRQPRDGPGSVGEGNRESACPEGSIGPRLTWESRNSTTTFSLLHRAAISHPRVVPSLKPAFPNSGSPTQPAREPSHATPPLRLTAHHWLSHTLAPPHLPGFSNGGTASTGTGTPPPLPSLGWESHQHLSTADTRPLPRGRLGVVVQGRKLLGNPGRADRIRFGRGKGRAVLPVLS